MKHKLKKLSIKIGVLAIIITMFCVIARIAVGNTITLYQFMLEKPEGEAEKVETLDNMEMSFEQEGIALIEKVRLNDGYAEIRIRAISPGRTSLNIKHKDSGKESTLPIKCGRLLTIYSWTDGRFTGDVFVLSGVCLFCLLTALMLLLTFIKLRADELYSYKSIFIAGFAFFIGTGGIGMIPPIAGLITAPATNSVFSVYSAISGIGYSTMLIASPFLLAFAIAMSISNIELLRHESFRFRNVLGIFVSVVMVLGEFLIIVLNNLNYAGSAFGYNMLQLFVNILSIAYVYFECMLIGSIICGFRAAKHVPNHNVDYIIILGCKFRKDGTLTPLLQSRCDAAIDLFKRQREKTGKQAMLIPSGGQGPDESMPEADAMANYILSTGVPKECVLRENQSKNTYQNMEFSKALIEKRSSLPDSKVVFATTNYHVFRSGLWAKLAGLDAEGIGGRTKWWFWPNAFMRECAGLMANRIKQEVILFIVLVMICVGLSIVMFV